MVRMDPNAITSPRKSPICEIFHFGLNNEGLCFATPRWGPDLNGESCGISYVEPILNIYVLKLHTLNW